MKASVFLTCLLVVLLAACTLVPQNIEKPSTVITVEVTRIVQITTTPVPTNIPTSTPTLAKKDVDATAIAQEIGTPIVASWACYETAQSQRDLNDCAAARLGKLEQQMAELVKAREVQYQQDFLEGLKKFQKFQAEWADLSDRECMFRSGLDGDGWPGTMAPMNYGECMIAKYEDRLRELQIEIFTWTH